MEPENIYLLCGILAGTYTVRVDPKYGHIPMQQKVVIITLHNVTHLNSVVV